MRAPVLMIQGTASSVGKSLIVAGLCRALKRRGIAVTPFKSQNMSLNAAVTPDGDEIGRAQALQAMAAGIEPSFDMNPILLKPESDRRSQVIVHGKVRARVQAADNYHETLQLRSAVAQSLNRLRNRFEFVVIEGAGSPAEINLQSRDIVNMHVAKLAYSPVVLVGDIDRGGVFAAIYGTIKLLRSGEEKYVVGALINKFRGDPALLQSGLRDLERLIERPVLGVIPFVHDLGLPEEDSLSFRQNRGDAPISLSSQPVVRIGVVRLPRMSNSDDFEPLERDSAFQVQYFDKVQRLEQFDVVILPGTKATIADLAWLRERRLDQAILEFADKGGYVMGICGGCQMLGRKIIDSFGVESNTLSCDGLGLLPIETKFHPQKVTAQVRAEFLPSRIFPSRVKMAEVSRFEAMEAYEIHCGETIREPKSMALFRILERNGTSSAIDDGAINENKNVIGTMLHGLFANRALRLNLIETFLENELTEPRTRRSMLVQPWSYCRNRNKHERASEEDGLDRLADVLEREIDIDAVLQLAREWNDRNASP